MNPPTHRPTPPTNPPNRSRFVGFGDQEIRAPEASHTPSGPSPWRVALVTTVLGAATGWIIDEVVRVIRGKKKQ